MALVEVGDPAALLARCDRVTDGKPCAEQELVPAVRGRAGGAFRKASAHPALERLGWEVHTEYNGHTTLTHCPVHRLYPPIPSTPRKREQRRRRRKAEMPS